MMLMLANKKGKAEWIVLLVLLVLIILYFYFKSKGG